MASSAAARSTGSTTVSGSVRSWSSSKAFDRYLKRTRQAVTIPDGALPTLEHSSGHAEARNEHPTPSDHATSSDSKVRVTTCDAAGLMEKKTPVARCPSRSACASLSASFTRPRKK